MLLATYPNARLLAPLARIGPAVCTNLGIAETSGEVVLLARTSASPPRDVFHSLTSALSDHDVAIAQPLVVDRPGLVVSAGAVFRAGQHPPDPFLAGHPVARCPRPLASGRCPHRCIARGAAVRAELRSACRAARRLDRRHAPRGRARCPHGRARWRRDGRGARVAADAQGRPAPAARHCLQATAPSGALAGSAERLRGSLGQRPASRVVGRRWQDRAAGRRTTTTRWTSRP